MHKPGRLGAATTDSRAQERPQRVGQCEPQWASDCIAQLLEELDLEFIALNPGSSFRGLHDSLVNFLGNANPQMLLCLHEEHAVAIAHGWAKITERPMGVALHSNVGLMHASMAIFNAWCDRVPVIMLGGNGPLDAAVRRPWIDWIHTFADTASMIRHFVKWDDQPNSLPAAQESLLRANVLARTAPQAPVYVALDAAMQESRVDQAPKKLPGDRFVVPDPVYPAPTVLARAVEDLRAAERPVILCGRGGRGEQAWRNRIALAERLGAAVLTDLKLPAAFPTGHPLHAADAGMFMTRDGTDVLRRADVILSLGWVDLAGAISAAWGDEAPDAKIIHASVDQHLHNGFSRDHLALAPVDLPLLCEADIAVEALLQLIPEGESSTAWFERPRREPAVSSNDDDIIDVSKLASELRSAVAGRETCLIRPPLSWAGGYWDIAGPLDYLGFDGGGGIGSGPGMAVGAALALRDSGRLPIAVLGDGDFMMGNSAIWTAVHYEIPLLIVVANNSSFFNDELHQDRVAQHRGRPRENRWIGQRIADPLVDIAGMARSQGAIGIGSISEPRDLRATLSEAVGYVEQGRCVVVDVRVAAAYADDFTNAAFGDGDE
jgi:thiamine pyrophosphate-dependent acetolactate synthase large subunit-like protein